MSPIVFWLLIFYVCLSLFIIAKLCIAMAYYAEVTKMYAEKTSEAHSFLLSGQAHEARECLSETAIGVLAAAEKFYPGKKRG